MTKRSRIGSVLLLPFTLLVWMFGLVFYVFGLKNQDGDRQKIVSREPGFARMRSASLRSPSTGFVKATMSPVDGSKR